MRVSAVVECEGGAARRPHGHHATVVMHGNVEQRVAALHLDPLLFSDADRRSCSVMPLSIVVEHNKHFMGSGQTTG